MRCLYFETCNPPQLAADGRLVLIAVLSYRRSNIINRTVKSADQGYKCRHIRSPGVPHREYRKNWNTAPSVRVGVFCCPKPVRGYTSPTVGRRHSRPGFEPAVLSLIRSCSPAEW